MLNCSHNHFLGNSQHFRVTREPWPNNQTVKSWKQSDYPLNILVEICGNSREVWMHNEVWGVCLDDLRGLRVAKNVDEVGALLMFDFKLVSGT